MREFIAQNRANWNARTALHRRSAFYDVPGFIAGTSGGLPAQDIQEVGPVVGKSLLHLQCHFGMDSISWAKRGARVTGVDLSEEAIRLARELASQMQVEADFICADVYALPAELATDFDVIYTTRGVLCWLPDLRQWAKAIAAHLAPGGILYLADSHPLLDLLAESGPELDEQGQYFHHPEPVRVEHFGSYAEEDPDFSEPVSYQWHHHLGEIITALAEAGLVIKHLHEFPFTFFPALPHMVRSEDGNWHLGQDRLPLSFSLLAERGC
jgi:SAM-dependent methyltransferase